MNSCILSKGDTSKTDSDSLNQLNSLRETWLVWPQRDLRAFWRCYRYWIVAVGRVDVEADDGMAADCWRCVVVIVCCLSWSRRGRRWREKMGGDVVVKVSVDWVRWWWFLILTRVELWRRDSTRRHVEVEVVLHMVRFTITWHKILSSS